MRIFLVGLLLVPLLSFAQERIDLDKTLFGIEYSFQDEEIVKEPGRNTMTTPYKEQRLQDMMKAYIQIRGLPESSIEEKTTWKPGYYINVPGDGKYIINTEPVTIEFNTTPKKLNEITEAATPIYKAATAANLKPYVNPAAERSGMGHIHIGGRVLRESPFYQHEHLLRNMIAFFHKHPSLLYGFAEAYDIGDNSNIETYHEEKKQTALANIIEEYDSTVLSTKKRQNGLFVFLGLLYNSINPETYIPTRYENGWFEHYRFINLEGLRNLTPKDSAKKGKYTVEFRGFRPPPTPLHAEALARLLVAVMDKMSAPGHLEKFEKISSTEFAHFFTGSKIRSDWEKVKTQLEINDPLLNDMVNELVKNIHSKKVLTLQNMPGYEVYESYSEKTKKGKVFEIRTSVKENPEHPQILIDEKWLEFEKVKIGRNLYWIAVVDTLKLKIDAESFSLRPNKYLKPKAMKCPILFAG